MRTEGSIARLGLAFGEVVGEDIGNNIYNNNLLAKIE